MRWLTALMMVVTLGCAGCPDDAAQSVPDASLPVDDAAAGEEPVPSSDAVAPGEDVPAPLDDVSLDDVSHDASDDVATSGPVLPGRHVHRMTIAQLARSIPVITGGIEWTEDFGQGPIDMLKVLYYTLGGPDFLLVTEENLDPSLIIAKFVQDAANRICTKWVERDRALPAAERTLTVHAEWDSLHPDDVATSLRALQLRVFARKIDTDDPEDAAAISALSQLFFAAAGGAPAGDETDDGWLAVCLGLMTSPEMVLY